jgi:peptidoglycan/xylan/chitin deacetylase (PgdA/CDA1 family)
MPFWLRYCYPQAQFLGPAQVEGKPAIYLSFDDGPHPEITPWVLEQLQTHQAQASFFCLGKNLSSFPTVHQASLTLGHALGNHTEAHANAWKIPWPEYLEQVLQCKHKLNSHLFRPPYGKIWPWQVYKLQTLGLKTVLWDVLSADFDLKINAKDCIQAMLRHTKPGSIVVFHDSEKAWPRLQKALPAVLKEWKTKGYVFPKLD